MSARQSPPPSLRLAALCERVETDAYGGKSLVNLVVGIRWSQPAGQPLAGVLRGWLAIGINTRGLDRLDHSLKIEVFDPEGSAEEPIEIGLTRQDRDVDIWQDMKFELKPRAGISGRYRIVISLDGLMLGFVPVDVEVMLEAPTNVTH